jgi:hypothetical protein
VITRSDDIKPGDLVRVFNTRVGVVVGRYGDGFYEVLVKSHRGDATVSAYRDIDLSLVQHPDPDRV